MNGFPQRTDTYLEFLDLAGDMNDPIAPTALYEAGILYSDGFREIEANQDIALKYFKRTLKATKFGARISANHTEEYEGARERILALEPGYFANPNVLIYFTNIGRETAFKKIEGSIPTQVTVHVHDTSNEQRLRESNERFVQNLNMDLRGIPIINRYSGIFSLYVIVDPNDFHINGCARNANDAMSVLLGDKLPGKCPAAHNKSVVLVDEASFSQSYRNRFSLAE